MRATLKRRLEALERRSNAAEMTPVPIVTIAHWPEEERVAFLREGEESDRVSLIVVTVHSDGREADVDEAPPVSPPTPEPEPPSDPLATLAEDLAERERRREEVEARIRVQEARRAGWY